MVRRIRLDQLMIRKGLAKSNKEAELFINSKKIKVKNFNSDIQTFNDQQSKLDERMANIRENYVEKFTAMESTVSSFKKTGNLLTNFMDAMTADK